VALALAVAVAVGVPQIQIRVRYQLAAGSCEDEIGVWNSKAVEG